MVTSTRKDPVTPDFDRVATRVLALNIMLIIFSLNSNPVITVQIKLLNL